MTNNNILLSKISFTNDQNEYLNRIFSDSKFHFPLIIKDYLLIVTAYFKVNQRSDSDDILNKIYFKIISMAIIILFDSAIFNFNYESNKIWMVI